MLLEHVQRFRRVEEVLSLLNENLTYKLVLVISPDWQAVLEKLAKDANRDPEKFINEIMRDEELKIEEGKGLFGKEFRFVCFYDGASGLEQIWSDYHGTFVDDIEVIGHIFEGKWLPWEGEGYRKYKDNYISKYLVIKPHFIGFHTILPLIEDVAPDDKLAQMPFQEIISFFIDMYRHLRNTGLWVPMYGIKKFPRKLQEEFDKYKVEYDKSAYEDYGTDIEFNERIIESEWAKKNGMEIYNQEMLSHRFTTPYYSIRIRMEVFERGGAAF